MLSKNTFSKLTKVENIIYLIIFSLTLIFSLNKKEIYYPDSYGYTQMSLIRSCGYPIFIELHKFLFGKNFITFLILTQITLNLLACFFLTRTIKKLVNLNKWLAITLFVILILPILMEPKSGNSILSEAIAYPLYLFIIKNILLGMFNKKSCYFYFSFVLTFILILIRGQFLSIIPVLLISVFITYYPLLLNKKTILLIVSILTIPILAIGTDIIYHKLKHDKAVTTPWTGLQIATIPLFVSDKDDYLLFENKIQQDYFKFIYNKLEKKKLLLNQIDQNSNKIDFFYENYCNISNFTINDDGIKFFNNKLSVDEKTILNDKITSSITITLIKNNFVKWNTIYIRNIIKGFGEIQSLFLILILLVLSIITNYNKQEFISKLIIIFSLLIIGNVFLVAIAESVITRYTFYNNWMVIAIVLILFSNYFQNKTNE